MRRAFLLAGIAAGAIVLFTTASVADTRRQQKAVDAFTTKLADLTYCRTGYEIASSNPHYAARFATDVDTRVALLRQSDALEARKEILDRMIQDHLKKGLVQLGTSFQTVVGRVQWQAELEVARTAGWVEKPDDFLDLLHSRCQPYLKK